MCGIICLGEKKRADLRGECIMLMREKIEENRISAFTTGMKKGTKDRYSRMVRMNKLNGRYYAVGYENIQRAAK